MDIKDNFISLQKSFSHAVRGIKYCIANERNMRIHISAMVLVLSFAYSYQATRYEFMMLIFCIGLVISCEMINTSIETIINLYSPAYNNLAKITKDVAAGAVLITAIVAVLVGGLIFCDINRLTATFIYIVDNKVILLYYIIMVIVCLNFIFKYTNKLNRRSRNLS